MVIKVKKEVKEEFLLNIISLIKKGLNPSQISKKLIISKQKLHYYIKTLKNLNLIKRTGYGVWEINKEEVKKFSLGWTQKPITNLHAFQISFPIIEGKIQDSDWQIKEKLNNWIPRYFKGNFLGGVTIKNNNNKSLTVWLETRNLDSLGEVYNLAFKVRVFMQDYFKKQGVILDVYNCETKNLDIGTSDTHSESMLGKGEKFELDLKKKAEKIFPKDNMDASAWLDGSPFKFTAETNDLEWKREYLSMPFKMRDTMMLVNYIAKNYASHVRLVEKASKIMSKIDKSFSTGKIGNNFIIDKSQKQLGAWI